MILDAKQFFDDLKIKLKAFGTFIYNRETNKILDRTCTSWAQIGAFFVVFYFVLAVIFAFHLGIFIAVTPGPGVGVTPWNFGKYAYMNYPNRKIDLILIPKSFSFERQSNRAVLGDYEYSYIDRLRSSAIASGVSDHCLNRENRFGFSLGKPCIYLHIAKVFRWIPEFIDPSLESKTGLPFSCTFIIGGSINFTLPIKTVPSVLPLNISNNNNSRSYPFLNQKNYKSPVMGLMLNFTSLPSDLPDNFRGEVTCSLNYAKLKLTRPNNRIFNRIYEIPTESVTKITFRP